MKTKETDDSAFITTASFLSSDENCGYKLNCFEAMAQTPKFQKFNVENDNQRNSLELH